MRILPRSVQVAALALMSLGMCKLEAQTCSAGSMASFFEYTQGYCRSGQNYTSLPYNVRMNGFVYCPRINDCPLANNTAASALAMGACSALVGTIMPYVGTSTCPGAYCQQAYYSDVGLMYWYGLALPYAADTVLFGSPWSCTYGSATMSCH